jgi:hypothetical protein
MKLKFIFAQDVKEKEKHPRNTQLYCCKINYKPTLYSNLKRLSKLNLTTKGMEFKS